MKTVTRRTGPISSEPPGYWITFDGSNDHIVLPAGHGNEPSTQLFIEAWLKNIDNKAGAEHGLICKGDSYTKGYTFAFSIAPTTSLCTYRLSIDNGVGYSSTISVAKSLMDSSVPIYVACGYDNSKIYCFAQGMLISTVNVSGALEYTGNNWQIGDISQASGVWPLKAKLGLLRVSSVCRHTASFTPPTSFVSDAYTVGLWRNIEGAGTTIKDSGPGGHTGTFKAAGEPAWSGEVVDLSTISHGEEIWNKCLDVVPKVTSGSVWLKRISANEYALYRKVHETGPYWVKWLIGRYDPRTDGPLEMALCYTGIPNPANETPNNWTTEPLTQLISGAANEYVFRGNITGGASLQWGNTHGYEVLDSESWTVDGVPTTLSNGQYVSGAEIAYHATQHVSDQDLLTRFVNSEKKLAVNTWTMYLEGTYRFDWLEDWYGLVATVFPQMTCFVNANLTTLTFIPGGTDYSIAAGASAIRAHAAAAWKADNGVILAQHVDMIDGIRYGTDTGCVINSSLKKLYFNRTVEIDGAKAGTRWAYSCRWMALDNCGNHFLKTT